MRTNLFGTIALAAIAIFLAEIPAVSAEEQEKSVVDYEVQLERISKEITEIRKEFEDLITEVAASESSRIFIFIERLPQALLAKEITLVLDEKTIFSRALEPAELDVLEKGLPVQLADLRLPPGEHTVGINVLGMEQKTDGYVFQLDAAKFSYCAAKITETGVEWNIE